MVVLIKKNILLRFTSRRFCRLRSISLCFRSPRLSSPVQSSLLIFPHTMTSSRFQCPLPNSFAVDCIWFAPGGGALPYMGYVGMCRCKGYGFQAVYSRIGYINQSVWV